jgi:hypothetical protein
MRWPTVSDHPILIRIAVILLSGQDVVKDRGIRPRPQLSELSLSFLYERLSEELNLQCVRLSRKEFVGVSDECALGLQPVLTGGSA